MTLLYCHLLDRRQAHGWAILFACNGDKGDTALDTATADTGPIPNPLADVDWLEDQFR